MPCFKGEWRTWNDTLSGNLKGTWSPRMLIKSTGAFRGQWIHDITAVSSTEVMPDGRLSGRYGKIELANGSSIHYFSGRWSSCECDDVQGRLGGLAMDGRYFGIWGHGGKARGYLKDCCGNSYFKGDWGHFGSQPQGRLWGTYFPLLTATTEPIERLP